MTRLLVALDHHRDEFATELIERHFVTTDVSKDPSASTHSDVDPNPLISRTGQSVAYGAVNPKYFPVERQRPSPPAPTGSRTSLSPSKPWTRRLTKQPASLCKFAVQ